MQVNQIQNNYNNRNITFGEVYESGPSLRELKLSQKHYNKYLERCYTEDQLWYIASEWGKCVISLRNFFKTLLRK